MDIRHVMFSISKEVEDEFWKKFKKHRKLYISTRGLKKFAQPELVSEDFLKDIMSEEIDDIAFDFGQLMYDKHTIKSITTLKNILYQLPKDSWIFLSLNTDFSNDTPLIREGNYKKMRPSIFVDIRLFRDSEIM